MKQHNIDSRTVALKVFENVLRGNTIQNALDQSLKSKNLSLNDAALSTELVYGYCRYYIRISSILTAFLSKPEKLPKKMFCLLGFAVYEILFLDKIPAYASVSYCVSKIRKLFGKNMAGVANGVLRKIIDQEDIFFSKEFYENTSDFYSVYPWMYNIFSNAFGVEDAKKILSRSLARPKVTIRLNPLHPFYDSLFSACEALPDIEKVGFSGFVFLSKKPHFLLKKTLEEWHSEGAISWQSAGSQYIMHQCMSAVPELTQHSFFDACAGQGGKSFILLEQGISVPLASDISLQRILHFRKTADRLGIHPPLLLCQSAMNFALRAQKMNIVLDVPCSGLGTLSRRPEIRLRRKQGELASFIKLQSCILENAWQNIDSHAYIIYVTCTLYPEENENQIKSFLERHTQSKLIFECQSPHGHPWLEGMYVAVLGKQ